MGELGVDVAFTAEPQPGGYITTQQVLEQIRDQSPPPPVDERPVVILAHPHHAWRCSVMTTLAGYVGSVPDARTSAGLQWQRFGCDDDGYDPESLQVHTRSFEAFYPYEVRHQQGICRRLSAAASAAAPVLAATHGDTDAQRATQSHTEKSEA